MTNNLRRRLEKLEAAHAEPHEDDVPTDDEFAALAQLVHVLRAAPGAARSGPVTDLEWSELQRAGLVPGDPA